MSNDFYNHGTFPTSGSAGTSSAMRAELDLVTAGFAKLPALTANGDKITKVNTGATALTISAATLSDAGAFSGTSATLSTLTSGRVPYATTAGLITDSANLTFNGTTLTGTFSGGLTGNVTGNASGSSGSCTGNAATVTTNANLTGPITSSGNATSVASQTGTGNKFVMDTSPILVTPLLGTPTSGVLTNCTGIAASLTAGTATVANGLKSATTTVVVSSATAPSNGQVLTASSSTAASWATPGAASFALSAITAAAASNSINNSDYAQTWNWALTTASKSAMLFTESSAATGGSGAQYLVDVQTLSASTAIPLRVRARGGADNLLVSRTGDITITASTGSVGGGTTGSTISLTSGRGASTSAGGAVSITSGAGGATSGASGGIDILTGTTTSSGNSGAITIKTSSVSTTGGAGSITIQTGDGVQNPTGAISILCGSNSNQNGNDLTLTAGGAIGAGYVGGTLALKGGPASGSTTSTGGYVTITSGAGGATSGNSGDVTIDSGSVVSGTTGAINIGTTHSTRVNILNGSGGLCFNGTFLDAAGCVIFSTSSTVPTIASGFGTSPSIAARSTLVFKIVIGSGGTASTGVITMLTANYGWVCTATNITNAATMSTVQTGSSTSSVTLTNYSRTTGTATPWNAGDVILISCFAL